MAGRRADTGPLGMGAAIPKHHEPMVTVQNSELHIKEMLSCFGVNRDEWTHGDIEDPARNGLERAPALYRIILAFGVARAINT